MIHSSDPASQRPQEVRVPSVRFMGEQDGPPERLLKGRLVEFFRQRCDVRRAYLAQIDAGGRPGVVLCVSSIFGPDRALAEKIGVIFAAVFDSREHLDIMFPNEEQEAALMKVCAPFWLSGTAIDRRTPRIATPFSLKLAYHSPHANTRQIPFPSVDPIPVFVAEEGFLQPSDFQSAEIVGTGSEFTMRFQLAPGAREKVNHLAELNQRAQGMEEYVALLLFLNGKPAQRLTMVFEPLPGYQMDYRGLTEQEAQELQEAVGPSLN